MLSEQEVRDIVNGTTEEETTTEEPTDAELANVSEPVAEPTTEEPTVEPTAEETVEEPTAEETVEEPTVEPTTEEPTAEETVEEPTVEPTAEEPTAEETVEEPTVETTAEEPTMETTAEETTVDGEMDESEMDDSGMEMTPEEMAEVEEIENSGLFDEETYLAENTDVAEAVANGETTAAFHFYKFGQFEQRSFNRYMNVGYYLQQNTDVEQAVSSGETTVFKHFKSFGQFEGRAFHPFINVGFYLEQNPDVSEAVSQGETSVFSHFFNFGRFENRSFNRFFNANSYLQLNPDVANAVSEGETTAADHFLNFGLSENREFNFSFSVTQITSIFSVSSLVEIGLETLSAFFSSEEGEELIGGEEEDDLEDGESAEDSGEDVEDSGEDVEDSGEDAEDSGEDAEDSGDDSSDDIEDAGDLPAIPDFSGGGSGGEQPTDDSGEQPTDDSGEEPTDDSGEQPTDGSGEEPTDDSGEEATSPLFDAQYVIEQNQEALQEQFPDFDFENLTEEQVAQVEEYVSQEGLQPSPSVNLSYFNSVVKEQLTSALQEEGLTEEEITNLSQKELLQKAVELGYSPTPLVQFDYFKSVHSEELTELASEKGIDLESLSNEELLKFITTEGVAEGLNPSAFFNFEFVKKQHKEKIREAVDIADGEEGVAELEPEKVLDNVFDSGEYYIDVRFVREQYSQQLIEFYGVTSVEELSDEQVEAYAFSEEAEAADVSMSPLNLEGFAAQYTAELTAFYSVESVEELSEYELYRFMATEAVEQGLDVTEYVEVSYYQSTFEAAMVATFGVASIEEVSAEQTVEFVFGDAAPYVDAEFFKLKYGEETTADGTLVKELSGEELKYYIFSAGWEAGFTNLSAFDIETFTTQYSAQVVEFYSASSIEEVSEAEIVDYMVGEAWKVGVDLSEFVTAEDVEVYRSEHEAGLAEYYGLTVEEVAELSAEIVVDFAFGGVSEAVDFDYTRFALGEEMVTYFTEQGETVTDASELSKLQVVEYLYAQDSLEAVKLSAFDVKGFVEANTDAIAEAFGVEAEEVAEIDREKLEKFMLGEGVQLGLSLSGYVELDYIRETYTEAIADSLEVSVEEVANLDEASLLEWVGSELSTIDVNYVGYQFEQLSETQQTDLLTNLEIDVDLTAGQVLTADQLVKIAYSEEFKAALEVEEVKLSAIDVSGYIADNADALSAFYGEAGIKVNSGSNKLKSGSLNFKSGNVAKSGSMKFNSSSMKLSGDSSMKLKSGSLKFKSGKISGDAEFDVSNLTDKQVVKFMFDTGWEQGINPLNYVEVEYLKSEFAVDIARYYDIEVSAVGELNDGLVLDYMYGGLSNDIDYSFVRSTYESELTSEFGVSSVEEVSDLQVLEYVYAQGPANVELSAVDVKGFVEQYGEQIAAEFGVDLSTAPEVSEFEIKSFMFNQASEQLGIDVSEFVNFEYYSANFSQQIVSNYRVENVFNLQSDMVYDFMSGEGISQGLATSPAIDLTWYRETYADILTQELETIDGDGNGEISDGELYDYAVGTGLENGQETSDSYDLESYFADDAVVDDLLNYSGATSIEEVSNLEKVEYIFGQGLSDGHSPDGLGLDAIKNDPANQDRLLQFASATSIEEVSMYQVYNYASSEGLLV